MNLHHQFVCKVSCVFFTIAIVVVSAWIPHVKPAAAQTFEERWSIIPKAKAEPLPEADVHVELDPQTQSTIGAEPTRGSRRWLRNSILQGRLLWKGLILFVSDRKNSERFLVQPEFPTAAHRSLPFGTRVRATDPAWIVS